MDQGFRIYDRCRGEDCLKPKGIQWARLRLRGQDAIPESCLADRAKDGGCPPEATDEAYVDVFNTHLQATGPLLCNDGVDASAFLLELCAGNALIPPGLCESLSPIAKGLASSCNVVSDEEVRQSQLEQLREFVASVVDEGSDQPAILGGDYNIDGRTLTIAEEEYAGMLDDVLGRDLETTDDLISTAPEAFSWDIDHSDLAREEPQYDWERCGHGTSHGTELQIGQNPFADGSFPSALDPDCPAWECDVAGDEAHERLDYLFVRPPAAREDGDPPGYFLARTLDAAPLWLPLWPTDAPDGDRSHLCAQAATEEEGIPSDFPRISDHRPIVTELEFLTLRHPGRFHPAWNHTVRSRVTSVTLTNEPDCFLDLCGPRDPFVEFEGWATDAGTGLPVPSPGIRALASCDNRDAGSLVAADNECMDPWFLTQRAPAGAYTQHSVTWRLFDSDTGFDDEIVTIDGTYHPRLQVNWDTSMFEVYADGEVPETARYEAGLRTSDPLRWCSSIQSPSFCVETSLEEQR